jgi:hypothetical protein
MGHKVGLFGRSRGVEFGGRGGTNKRSGSLI